MRWVALIFCLFAHQAAAQWVEFDVCGFKMPDDSSFVPEETQVAPRRGPVHIWAPSIMMVVGYKEMKGPPCTKLMLQGKQIYVIGDLEETIAKINRARGQ